MVGRTFYSLPLGIRQVTPCRHCQRTVAEITRSWIAPTLLAIPLAVVSVDHHYKCMWCKDEVIGPTPPESPPLPFHQRFGTMILAAVLLLMYGQWRAQNAAIDMFGGGSSGVRNGNASLAAGAKQAEEERTANYVAIDRAKNALEKADHAISTCEVDITRMGATEIAKAATSFSFSSSNKKKLSVPEQARPSRELATTPYRGIHGLSLGAENASSLGGLACSMSERDPLHVAITNAQKRQTDGTLGVGERTTLTRATEALEHETQKGVAMPPVVVVASSACTVEHHVCRASFVWVDTGKKNVAAFTSIDLPWSLDATSGPVVDKGHATLRARVESWK